MTGPALLKRYLRDTKQRPAEFARTHGLDEGRLSRLLRKMGKPDIENATLIERVTEGAVPAISWASGKKRRKQHAA